MFVENYHNLTKKNYDLIFKRFFYDKRKEKLFANCKNGDGAIIIIQNRLRICRKTVKRKQLNE